MNRTRLTEADGATSALVQDALNDKRRLVSRKLAVDYPSLRVDALFTVPSDDYIYFRPAPDGSVQVMLVAWDFKLPARQEGTEVVISAFEETGYPPEIHRG